MIISKVFPATQLFFLAMGLSLFGSLQAQQSRGISSVEQTTDPIGTRRALLVGISKYKNPDRALTTAGEDPKLMKKFLSENKFYDKDISLLLDSNATASNTMKELRKILDASKANDEVVLYFSLDYERNSELDAGYLLMYAVERKALVGSDVIDILTLKKYLDSFDKKGVKVIFAVEASHSGEIAQDWKVSPNVVLLLSCSNKELSKEENLDDKGYGAFTYYMIQGLQGKADANGDNAVTLNELKFYLRRELRNINQSPVMVGDLDRVVLKVDQPQKSVKAPENNNAVPAR